MSFVEALDTLIQQYPEQASAYMAALGIGYVETCTDGMKCALASMILLGVSRQDGNQVDYEVREAVLEAAISVRDGQPICGVSDRALDMQIENSLGLI